MTSVEGIHGKQRIMPSGKLATNRDGNVKRTFDSTVMQYVDGVRLFGETTV